MRALTVSPGVANSLRLEEVPAPDASEGSILARTLTIGMCGTDHEIAEGLYGRAPEGQARLIVGHESLGEVLEAPAGCGFARGDLVVGIVRRPDPVPCASCARGEWDMCRNDRYTERGIAGRHGYASELFRVEPEFAVRVDPSLRSVGVLIEPASVVAKAWEQIERIGQRAQPWQPRSALITGAGPIGLLAALLGVQRGLEVHVFDRVSDGPKPGLVRELGASYHSGNIADIPIEPDVVLECTGASALVFDVMSRNAPLGIVCLTGVSSGGRKLAVDVGLVNRTLVLENDVVFGSVNANRRHYEAAAAALARAERGWLSRLITRRVALEMWPQALLRTPQDVKVVLDFSA